MASLIVMCAGGAYAVSGFPAARERPVLATSSRPGHSRRFVQAAGKASRSTLSSAFMVTDTGTRYQEATLQTQVSARLAGQVPVGGARPSQSALTGSMPIALSPALPGTWMTKPASAPPASGSPGLPGALPGLEVAPSRSLVGCVMHLTGDVRPELVDRATYQSRPAYVIAIPDEAWVVGVACTATRPALMASVRLGG